MNKDRDSVARLHLYEAPAEPIANPGTLWQVTMGASEIISKIDNGQKARDFTFSRTEEGLTIGQADCFNSMIINFNERGKTISTKRFRPPALPSGRPRLLVEKFCLNQSGQAEPEPAYERKMYEVTPEEWPLDEQATLVFEESSDNMPAIPLENVLAALTDITEELALPPQPAVTSRVARVINWLNRS